MRSGNEGLEAVDLALKMLGVMTRLNSNVATAFCAAKIPNFLGVVGVMLGAALREVEVTVQGGREEKKNVWEGSGCMQMSGSRVHMA